MKKVLIWLFVVVFAISFSFMGIGCKEEPGVIAETVTETVTETATETVKVGEGEELTVVGKPLSEIKVGYIMPYLEGWFYYWDIGWKVKMRSENIYTEAIFTYWDPEADLQAVRDFITKGFDMICLESASPDVVQSAAQICNEANVPLIIENTSIADGPGTVVADVEFDWVDAGRKIGTGIAENWPGVKIVEFQGGQGFWPVEGMIQGMDEIQEETGAFEVIQLEYNNDYSTEVTFNSMSAIVQAGTGFDCVFGGWQEGTEAIIEALKTNNVPMDAVVVISSDGGPLDVQNFKDGELDGAITYPVGFHAMLVATIVIEYLKGNPIPKVFSPSIWCTQADYKEKLIDWEVDESWLPIVEKYLQTGKLEK